MEHSSTGGRILRFDAFEVDLEERELRRSGSRVKIQEQPFQLLVMLLERPGSVVTREHLQKELWPDGTFVDFEHGLNTAVKRLRDALGDSAEIPRFVETVARRGYRFIGSVDAPVAASAIRPRRWQRLFTRRNAVVGGLIAAGLAILLIYLSPRFKSAEPVVTPAVTDVGEKYTPSLSPDGQHLAFAWNGGAGPHVSVYVKQVGTEESLRLTKQQSIDFNPVWSPDGRYIAFCRILKGASGIYVIPASGGAERKVRSTLWEDQEFYENFWVAGHLAWSPDGKLLAYSDHISRGDTASIFLLSLDSLDSRRLTSPSHAIGDFSPEFSPDGRTLAFIRVSQVSSIYVIPVSGGREQHVASDNRGKRGLAWMPDGREIVFANLEGLWKVSLSGGEPKRLQFGQGGIEPSIRGKRLVYVQRTPNLNIWKRSLKSPVSVGPPEKFLTSTRMQNGPQFSPDGNKIAFESNRSGDYEVWVSQSDGRGLMQLTHFSPSQAGTPRWSPDGQQIVFDARPGDNVDIYVIDSQGGPLRKLTQEPSNENVPSWSRDGRWIYFASDRTGAWQVWKTASTGGPAVQVTRHGGFAAFESPDRKFLYYAKGLHAAGIWRVPTNGGEEAEVISSPEAGYWGYWAIVTNGIYYLDTSTHPAIAFYDFTTRRATKVFDLSNRPAREVSGLAVAPDQSTILYTQTDSLDSDIILVDNFR